MTAARRTLAGKAGKRTPHRGPRKPAVKPKKWGSMKGKIKITPDFDDPLPLEFFFTKDG